MTQQPISESNLTLLGYWRIIERAKWMIAGVVVVSVLLTGVISKLSPNLYEAKVTIIPSRQEIGGGGAISFGGDKEKGGGAGGMATELMGGGKSGPSASDILQAILVSRVMGEKVCEQLNLQSYYNASSLSQALRAFSGEINVKVDRYKMLEVSVMTKDPKMAAEMANALVSNLHQVYKDLNISAAKQNRVFIESRLAEKTKLLNKTEEALKEFQTEHRIFTVKEQTDAASHQVGTLHAEIVELEVQLAALREYATPSHPMINQLQTQIREYRRELDRMESDQLRSFGVKPKVRAPLSAKAFPSIEEAPSLALNFLRLTRQVKVEEAVYGMLVGMLEQAKIAEVRDLPTFQVLDPAVPPEHKSRPKTLENIKAAGAVSLVMGILLAFFLNYLEQLKIREQVLAQNNTSETEDMAEVDRNGNGSESDVYSVAPREIERLHG